MRKTKQNEIWSNVNNYFFLKLSKYENAMDELFTGENGFISEEKICVSNCNFKHRKCKENLILTYKMFGFNLYAYMSVFN